MDTAGGALRRLGAAVRAAVHLRAKKAQIDPLLLLFITLANYGLLRHLLLGPGWRWWWLGWFFAGIGVITKGVGMLALLMIVPAVTAAVLQWPRVALHARDARFWLAPLAFLLAVSLWLAPMLLAGFATGSDEYRAYMDDILFQQTARRYTHSWDHHQPWWYFTAIMPSMWIPAFLLLPWALPAWLRRLRRRDPRYLLPLSRWLMVVLFFSIPDGKRDVYILPALPMFCGAGAVAARAAEAARCAGRGGSVHRPAVTGPGLAGAMAVLGDPAFELRLTHSRGLAPGAVDALARTITAMGVWGALSLLACGRRRHLALVSTTAMVWVLYSTVGYPLLNDSSSARGLMRTVGTRLGRMPSLGWWLEGAASAAGRPPAATFGFESEWDEQLIAATRWQRLAPERRWLLVHEYAMLSCVDRSRSELAGVANRRRWWLVPATAVKVPCVVTAEGGNVNGVCRNMTSPPSCLSSLPKRGQRQ